MSHGFHLRSGNKALRSNCWSVLLTGSYIDTMWASTKKRTELWRNKTICPICTVCQEDFGESSDPRVGTLTLFTGHSILWFVYVHPRSSLHWKEQDLRLNCWSNKTKSDWGDECTFVRLDNYFKHCSDKWKTWMERCMHHERVYIKMIR